MARRSVLGGGVREAALAQLGERQAIILEVPSSILGVSNFWMLTHIIIFWDGSIKVIIGLSENFFDVFVISTSIKISRLLQKCCKNFRRSIEKVGTPRPFIIVYRNNRVWPASGPEINIRVYFQSVFHTGWLGREIFEALDLKIPSKFRNSIEQWMVFKKISALRAQEIH